MTGIRRFFSSLQSQVKSQFKSTNGSISGLRVSVDKDHYFGCYLIMRMGDVAKQKHGHNRHCEDGRITQGVVVKIHIELVDVGKMNAVDRASV